MLDIYEVNFDYVFHRPRPGYHVVLPESPSSPIHHYRPALQRLHWHAASRQDIRGLCSRAGSQHQEQRQEKEEARGSQQVQAHRDAAVRLQGGRSFKDCEVSTTAKTLSTVSCVSNWQDHRFGVLNVEPHRCQGGLMVETTEWEGQSFAQQLEGWRTGSADSDKNP